MKNVTQHASAGGWNVSRGRYRLTFTRILPDHVPFASARRAACSRRYGVGYVDAIGQIKPDIQRRSFEFVCQVIDFCDWVTDTRLATVRMVSQLFNAASSIGANLEEAAAGQTKPDFISKAFVSLKEARETRYWLRLLQARRPAMVHRVAPLLAEAEQLVAILTAILRSARESDSRG